MHRKILIRKAELNDAALLASVGREAFAAAFSDQNSVENMEAYLSGAFSEAIQAAEIVEQDSLFLIAETEESIVGYARLLVSPAPTCITGTTPLELVRFYLLPEWIGKGVSGTLMQACLDAARGGGHDVIWLGVWQENPRAIRFYEKWGFSIVGTHTFQLGADTQHDWIMACLL